MPRPTRTFFLPHVATAGALVFAALYLAVAIPRVLYPFDLDFIENSQLLQALRFVQGQPVFTTPSAEFAAQAYMPLYTWLSGQLFHLTGPGYLPLRLLSLTATLATSLCLGWIACRESGQNWVGIACAGLYLAGYRVSGFWYELGRVDSLMVTLALGGTAVGIYARRSRLRLVFAAVLLALAFFTKQTSLALAGGLGLWLLATTGWRAVWFVAPFSVLTVGGFGLLNWMTGDWFYFYTVLAASGDAVEMGRVVHYIVFELFGRMGGLSLLVITAIVLTNRRLKTRWPIVDNQPWLMSIGVACFISGVGRASVGGNLNNLMPAYAFLCLAPALAAHEISLRPNDRRGIALVSALVLAQLALGLYNPVRYVPTLQMRASGERLIESIAATPGEVLVLMHPSYAFMAGKTPSAQIATLWYLLHWQGRALPPDFVERLRERYYAAIISDESLFETDPVINDLIAAHYHVTRTLTVADAPPTMTGLVVRPQLWWEPRP